MSFHLPQIYSPVSNQTASPRINLGANKYHAPSKFGLQPSQQPFQNNQLDSLDQLSQKRPVPTLQLPSFNNGSFEGPSYNSLTDRSPMYNPNPVPVSMPMPMPMPMPLPMPMPMEFIDPRLNSANVANAAQRSSLFLNMRRNVSSTNPLESPQARGGILRMNTIQDTTPQARSYSPSVRQMIQRQDSFTDRVLPYTQQAPQESLTDRGPPLRRESSFKKVYDISIKESKSKFSYEQQAFDKHLERQHSILDRVVPRVEPQQAQDLENYKLDIENQIKQLQQKKVLVDLELEKKNKKQIERYESEPNHQIGISEAGSDGSAKERKEKKQTFQERLIRKITLAKQNSGVHQALEDVDSEYSSLGEHDGGENTPRRIKTQPNEFIKGMSDPFEADFKIETKKPELLKKAVKHSDSYDPSLRGSLQTSLLRKNTETSGDDSYFKKNGMDSSRTDSDVEELKTPLSADKKTTKSKILSVFAKKKLKEREREVSNADSDSYGSDTEKKPNFAKRSTDVVKRKKAQMRIQSLTWIMISMKLLFNESRRRAVQKKKEMDEEIISKLMPTKKTLRDYIYKVAGNEIITLLTGKQYSSIFVGNKSVPNKKLDKECKFLKDQLKSILKKMTQNISTLPNQYFSFMKTLTEEGSILPGYYFSDFELNRLRFTFFGRLKHVQPSQSKLILGGITLIRVLIFTMMMQPWEVFDIATSYDEEDEEAHSKYNKEKLLNIGSLMYNVVMELLKDTVPLNENVSNISFEMKVHPKRRLPRALGDTTNYEAFDIRRDISRDGEIITDFYPRQQLSCFFNERKEMVAELKEAVQGWLDALYNKTHNV